jgi:hypothetical protein
VDRVILVKNGVDVGGVNNLLIHSMHSKGIPSYSYGGRVNVRAW